MALKKLELNEEAKKFLSGGILSKVDIENEKTECRHHCLRMPISMIKRIDQTRKARIGVSRTLWILEAIEDKLKRTEK
jgi:hypothetical protein